jgi:hypothetical protein
MKENNRQNIVNGIIRSEHSLPNENLKLVGFSCNVSGCTWSLGSNHEYFEALREHGQHNLEKHINNTLSKIIYNYKRK